MDQRALNNAAADTAHTLRLALAAVDEAIDSLRAGNAIDSALEKTLALQLIDANIAAEHAFRHAARASRQGAGRSV